MPASRQLSKAAAVAVLALGAGIGPSATAHAVPYLGISTHVEYHALDHSAYQVSIDGVITMSQSAAQDAINHGYTIALRYWGDDPQSDDLLAGPIRPNNVSAAADGMRFQHSLKMMRANLNEDSGVVDSYTDSDADEIYIGVRLLDPNGKTVSQAESDRIVDYF